MVDDLGRVLLDENGSCMVTGDRRMTIDPMSAVLRKPGAGRVQQTLGEILSSVVDIREFGGIGDNSTDNTSAINAAILSGEPIYFPPGAYRAYGDIVYTKNFPPIFIGAHPMDNTVQTSRIVDYRDATEKPLITRSDGYMLADGSYTDGVDSSIGFGNPIIMRNMNIRSARGKYSSCIDVLMVKNALFENCRFMFNYRGITLSNWTFDVAVLHCTFNGFFFTQAAGYGQNAWPADRDLAALAWGLYSAGHAHIFSCEATGAGTALNLVGVGCNLVGARIEQCGYGIRAGGTQYNIEGPTANTLSASFLGGIRIEANAVGLHAVNLDSTDIRGGSIQGSPANPVASRDYNSESGLVVDKMDQTSAIAQIKVGGFFSRSGLVNRSDRALWGVSSSNSAGPAISGQNRALNTRASSGSNSEPGAHAVNALMFPDAVKERHRTLTAFHDLMLFGLTGLNIRDRAASGTAEGGPVFAKNLGGIATPSASATSVAVVFPAGLEANSIAFSADPSLVEDAESELEPGAYTYATTCVAPTGETCINANAEKAVAVGEGEKVSMSFYGTAQNVKRRIYRAGADGWYDGYWEQDGHARFVDDGTRAFDGLGAPPAAGNIPSRAEDDAGYQIIATPSWATTVHVSNKATTGFTLNFGTAAPDGAQTVAWLLFRP